MKVIAVMTSVAPWAENEKAGEAGGSAFQYNLIQKRIPAIRVRSALSSNAPIKTIARQLAVSPWTRPELSTNPWSSNSFGQKPTEGRHAGDGKRGALWRKRPDATCPMSRSTKPLRR